MSLSKLFENQNTIISIQNIALHSLKVQQTTLFRNEMFYVFVIKYFPCKLASVHAKSHQKFICIEFYFLLLHSPSYSVKRFILSLMWEKLNA